MDNTLGMTKESTAGIVIEAPAPLVIPMHEELQMDLQELIRIGAIVKENRQVIREREKQIRKDHDLKELRQALKHLKEDIKAREEMLVHELLESDEDYAYAKKEHAEKRQEYRQQIAKVKEYVQENEIDQVKLTVEGEQMSLFVENNPQVFLNGMKI